MKKAYFTICAKNYLAYALSLRDSLLVAEPNARMFIVLADTPLVDVTPAPDILAVDALHIPNLEKMAYRYSVTEFATAIKPFCFEFIFKDHGFDSVVYLDPDIQVFQALTEVDDLLADGASAVLTPHLLSPLTDNRHPDDIAILSGGTFNLGFLALAAKSEVFDYLGWWKRQLSTNCYIAIEAGLFVDQKFMDFAPSFLEDCSILRHPGYNVAYWNLANRHVQLKHSKWTVSEHDLVFFHFSGVVPGNTQVFSKHQDRFGANDIGEVQTLLKDYLGRLDRFGHSDWSEKSYAFGCSEDGARIPDIIRRYNEAVSWTERGFEIPDWDYWNAASAEVDQESGRTFTRIMMAIYNSRRDLRDAFPLGTKTGRSQFHLWFVEHAAAEFGIPADCVDAALLDGNKRNLFLAAYVWMRRRAKTIFKA